MRYAELAVTSNFSFLRGASHPEELVETAAALGLTAVGIADRNSLAGVVRAHLAAKRVGIRLLVGARLVLEDGLELLCFPEDRAAYGRLSTLLSRGKRRAAKGDCVLRRDDLPALGAAQQLVVMTPGSLPPDRAVMARWAAAAEITLIARWFPECVSLAVAPLWRGGDRRRLAAVADLAAAMSVPLLACGDVLYHHPTRRVVADVLSCIRDGVTIDAAGRRLAANAERFPRSASEMAALFRGHGAAMARSVWIAERCRFSLDSLRYDYPVAESGGGQPPQAVLEAAAWRGARERWPAGVPARVTAAIQHELALIDQLGYAPYFLTVHDMVRFARSRDILCQGRGSAANSAVCYCLGITAVDPSRVDLLFERFVSAERDEPPDIDVDFEHERREEVIQYVYTRYGRDRAGLAATVIRYRGRGALREVGKAMGLSADTITALTGQVWGWGREGIEPERVRAAGLDPDDPRLALTLEIASAIQGFPRHLSQHVGGFVITQGPLHELAPIENAAMVDRTVIEWDKDDLDALGILKIDVLALGMLTCVRKGLDLLARHHNRTLELATVPAEDPAVYDMLCQGDSIGVFQVESRAQMSMLPRLKPRSFYDLVIEVAIVRPGPIQGDMVHPYLRRRVGEERVEYPSDELRSVLEKTLGVPLFQEQAMRIAIVAAGFTPSEADGLRRAMATFRKVGTIQHFHDKLVEGMVARGYDRDFATRCFRQIEGFGTYGFPESHAASFALLVYVSAWLKCHYPAVFACALLNSQPMGFYAPAQIVRDARDHGVEVRPVDVNASEWDTMLEPTDAPGGQALRLGLRQVKGLREADAARLVGFRGNGYPDLASLWRRARLAPAVLETLARADAFGSLGLGRREALWQARALDTAPLPLFDAADLDGPGDEPPVCLPEMPIGERVAEDYAALRLTLRAHPLSLWRDRLAGEGVIPAERLAGARDGARVAVAGLVLVRQRPGSAKGVVFVTLEDETGVANLIVWPDRLERFRRELLGSSLLEARGRLQKEGAVIHVVVDRLVDRTDLLRRLAGVGAPLRIDPARADEVLRPIPENKAVDRRPGRHLGYASRDFH